MARCPRPQNLESRKRIRRDSAASRRLALDRMKSQEKLVAVRGKAWQQLCFNGHSLLKALSNALSTGARIGNLFQCSTNRHFERSQRILAMSGSAGTSAACTT